jgi:hypothetical protein
METMLEAMIWTWTTLDGVWLLQVESRKKDIKDYEGIFGRMMCEVLCEPTLPYDHITPMWEGA